MDLEQVSRLFTAGNDYETLGSLSTLYAGGSEEAKDLPATLIQYYLKIGRHGNLNIEEAQAGMDYRPDIALWDAFIKLGADGKLVSSLIPDAVEAEAEIANFNRLKAGLDRRNGRLQDAEDALLTQREILGRNPASHGKLAFVEYELGYINFLQAEPVAAIEHFRASFGFGLEGDDLVGAWIGKSLEFRVRWLFGFASDEVARSFFRLARIKFAEFEPTSPKRTAARRWILNSILHELEVETEVGNAEAVTALLRECRTPPIESIVPAVPGFLEFYEAMGELVRSSPRAITLLETIIERKKRIASKAQWYTSEAGARDSYFLGLARKRTGDLTGAKAAWEETLAFAETMGNQLWKARGRAELDFLNLRGEE